MSTEGELAQHTQIRVGFLGFLCMVHSLRCRVSFRAISRTRNGLGTRVLLRGNVCHQNDRRSCVHILLDCGEGHAWTLTITPIVLSIALRPSCPLCRVLV